MAKTAHTVLTAFAARVRRSKPSPHGYLVELSASGPTSLYSDSI